MTDINLRILLNAVKGNTTSVIGDVTKALGPQAGGLQGAMIAVGIGAAALAIGIGVKAVQAAREYQSAMTQLQNTTGSSDAQMKGYTATIRELSDTTGKAQVDLAKGMYQIVSANFAGADATRILTTATQAAIIAGADQTKVTTGLVVTLNAFGLKADQVDSVSNRMFKTLSLGRGQMGDLASALQTGGALVAHYGVSVTDMDATLATLSTGGMKTFGTSMTGLTQLLNTMDGKTDLITGRLHKLGIKFDENKFQAMTYTQQIAYLNEAFKGHEKQMVAVLGSKQAATALGILGTQSQLLASNLKKLGDAQELAKEKTTAWSKVQGDFNFQWEKFKTNMQNLLIDLGLKLLPYLTPIVKAFSDWAVTLQYTFVPWLRNAVDDISQFIGWMQQGSAPANALKALIIGIGFALLEIKIYKFGQDVFNTFNNAKAVVGQFIDDILGIGTSSTTAEVEVATNTGLMDTELASVGATAEGASLAIGEVGAASTGAEAAVAAAAGGMVGALAAVIGVVGGLALALSTLPGMIDVANQLGMLPDWLKQMIYGKNPYATAPHTSGSEVDPYLLHSSKNPILTRGTRNRFASGVTNFSGGLAYVHAGEVLANLAPHTNVIPANRVNFGGGGVNVYLTVNNPMRTRADTENMLDEIEQGIARRFRGQTPGYGFGGIT